MEFKAKLKGHYPDGSKCSAEITIVNVADALEATEKACKLFKLTFEVEAESCAVTARKSKANGKGASK